MGRSSEPPRFFKMYPRQLITAPTQEPVSLLELREQMQMPTEEDNALIESYAKAAREYVEGISWRALVTQTWDIYPPCFNGDRFRLPFGRLQSVTYVKFTDTSDTQTTVSSGDYHVDTVSEPGQIVLAYGKSWPTATLRTVNPIVIRAVFGYGLAADVPQIFKDAIRLLAAHRYSNREPVVVSDRAGVREQELPFGVIQALDAVRAKYY